MLNTRGAEKEGGHKLAKIRHVVFIYVDCSNLLFQLNSHIGRLNSRDLPEGWKINFGIIIDILLRA